MIARRLKNILASSAAGLCASVLLLAAAERDARAAENQHHIGLDPSLAMLKVDGKSTLSVGAGVAAHYTYGLSDQFNLMTEVGWAKVALNQDQDADAPRTRPSDVSYAGIGIGYVLDVIQWVPYFGALAAGYWLSGGTLDAKSGVCCRRRARRRARLPVQPPLRGGHRRPPAHHRHQNHRLPVVHHALPARRVRLGLLKASGVSAPLLRCRSVAQTSVEYRWIRPRVFTGRAETIWGGERLPKPRSNIEGSPGDIFTGRAGEREF